MGREIIRRGNVRGICPRGKCPGGIKCLTLIGFGFLCLIRCYHCNVTTIRPTICFWEVSETIEGIHYVALASAKKMFYKISITKRLNVVYGTPFFAFFAICFSSRLWIILVIFRMQCSFKTELLSLLLLPPLRSFCHSVNRITDERGNGRRSNMTGTGKRWPSRSD